VSGRRLLTTAEVARRLDVKLDTVYAYVSRGLLTSVRGSRRQGSLFDPDEVDRVARRGREGRSPSGEIERIRTGVTLLEDDELFYRGHRVVELAGVHTFEAVARLLWTGELGVDAVFVAPAERLEVAAGAVATLPPSARLTDRIRVAVAAAAAADPLRYDLAGDAMLRRVEGLIALLVDVLATTVDRPARAGALAARLWPALAGRPADPAEVRLLDAILVLLADHDLAVSTVAARIAASARAHPYAVVSAGLGAIDGPHHGTVSTLAHRFLGEALADPVGALSERLRGGAPVPGFGHRVYRDRDPRAEFVLTALREHARAAAVLAVVETVREALADRSAAFPNVDLALAAVIHAFDLRADAGEAVFALARVAGWIAHALEEYDRPGLRFRPEGLYSGPRPEVDAVKIDRD
jgi:citrate synthase